MGDKRGEAKSLNNIGAVYLDLNEYQNALDYYNQALKLWRIVEDRAEEAKTLGNIGSVYGELGEEQKALKIYERALTLHRVVKNKIEESTMLHNIGASYRKLNDNQKALEYFNQSLSLRQTIGDSGGLAYTLGNIAIVHYQLGNFQKAKDYYNQSLPLFRKVGNRLAEVQTIQNIGTVYHYGMKDFKEAMSYYEQAFAMNRNLGNRSGDASVFYNMARLERDRGNLVEARAKIEAAIPILESLRREVASHELRASYFATMQKYFDFYIDVLMDLHQQNQSEELEAVALQTSEQQRARSLLETLTEARIDIRKDVDSALIEQERVLQQKLNARDQLLMQLQNRGASADRILKEKKEIEELSTEYQAIQGMIRAASPHYVTLIHSQPLSAKEIQKQVLDEKTVLLEYSLGEKRSFLWAVMPTSIQTFTLPSRAEIDSVARRVYELMTERSKFIPTEKQAERNKRIQQVDVGYEKAVRELSKMILDPISDLLGEKRLLIVADGALQYIPFAALPEPKAADSTESHELQTLILKHEIVSLPSASVLAVLRKEFADRKPAPKLLAMVADPVVSSDDSRLEQAKAYVKKELAQPLGDTALVAHNVRDLEFQRATRGVFGTARGDCIQPFGRLLFAGREAEAILTLASTGENLKAVGFDANHATATSLELSAYRIVHFAAHGLLNSEHPELSGIVLSLLDSLGNSLNGFLRLNEIYNMKLNADLVVLSACQTALGKEIKGEGLIGLTRGFMYAGTPRVVASLWKVEDLATSELMKRFYQNMLGEKRLRPAAALRAAQIEMWQSSTWKAPYYWAAFVLQGEWR